MHRHRTLVIFGIAWLSALVLSVAVYRHSAGPAKRDTVTLVAAVREVPAGKRLEVADLKLMVVDRTDVPQGAVFKMDDVAGRAALVPLAASEIVLDKKLAPKAGGEGLSALIEPGMRAVSVQVNDTSGVGGFVQAGSRVDVLFTRFLPNGDAATATIIQNAKVIAYGKQLEGGKTDTKIGPGGQTVATLLVTQDDAEKVALATQRGRIHLVLRNPLDDKLTDAGEPTRSADLGIADPVRPAVVVKAPEAATAKKAAFKASGNVPLNQAPRDDGRITVRVFRGSKVSDDIF